MNTNEELIRLECIKWLEQNDRNGCYSDEDCMNEFGWVMSFEDAIKAVNDHIEGE